MCTFINIKSLHCTLYIKYNFVNYTLVSLERVFQVVLVVKNLPANARDVRDVGSFPRTGRFPGGRHGNPLQYSFLENPMDRGAWQATVHRATISWT